jgi:bifunctional DNA-binding transcriptional regulator/antitoxin component of YhaV-PrlF toxin-antitoxin module
MLEFETNNMYNDDLERLRFKAGDKIEYIEYYDHAISKRYNQKFVLIAVGKVIKESMKGALGEYLILTPQGAKNIGKKPDYFIYILKSSIKSRKVIYEIEEDDD